MDTIDRRSGIGGSEAAAVCGLSRWRDPVDVWLVKTGRKPDFEGNLATRGGLWMENFIAQEYADVTGRSLKKGAIRRHPKHGRILGTPDFYVIDEGLGLECKFTGWLDHDDWGPSGTDLIPIEYLCQVQQYMEVCDLPYWDVAVMAGTRLFRIYTIPRDQELIDMLVLAEERFFLDHVLADVPPPLETTEAAERYVKYVHGKQTTDAFVKADTEAEHWSDMLQMVRGQLEPLEEAKTRAEVELKLRIGDAAGIEGPDFQHSWKQSKEGKEINWEGIARELHASPAVIQKHTVVKPGNRRFLAKWFDSQGG